MKRDTSSGAIGVFKYNVGILPANANSVAVTHGVGSAPSHVSVTPADGLEAPFQVLEASITSTQFTVSLPGGLTLESDAKFLWGAFK